MEQDAIKFLSTRVLGRSKTFTQEELVKLLVDFKATGLNYSPEVLNDLLESSYDTGYLEGLRDGKISIQR